MDIVCKIVNSVKEIINDRSKVSADAVFVAYDFMNVKLSSEEIDGILKFAEKLEIRESPNFRSLYNDMVNDAIWSIVCWATQCYRMVVSINELIAIDKNESIILDIELGTDRFWRLLIKGECIDKINLKKLKQYNGLKMLFEILDEIIEIMA